MRKLLFTNSLLLLLLVFSQVATGQSYQKVVDSLLYLLPERTDAVARVDLLNEISYAYRRVDPQQTLIYGHRAAKLAEQLDYLKGQSIAAKNIGIAHYSKSSPADSTLFYYQKSISVAEKVDDFYTQAAVNNNIGLVYAQSSKYRSAIRHYLRGIEIYDKYVQKVSFLQGLMYSNLASSYARINQLEQSVLFYRKATAIGEKNNYPKLLGILGSNLAQVLVQMDSIKRAEFEFAKALKLQEELGDFRAMARTLHQKADFKLQQDSIKRARQLAERSLSIATEKKFKREIMRSKLTLARVAFAQKQFEQVVRWGEEMVVASNNTQHERFQQDVRELMIAAYRALGDLESAFVIADDFRAKQDAINQIDREQFAEELEAKFINIQQGREIEFLNKEKALNNQLIKWLTGFITLMVLGVFWIGYLLKKRNQSNRIIEAKRQELEHYIEYNLQLENFAYIASHDLKTPLRTIVSFSQLLRRSAIKKLNSTEGEYLDFIIRGTKEMSRLIEDLLAYSKIQKSELNKEEIPIEMLIQNILEKNQAYIKEKSAVIALDIQTKNVKADEIKLNQLLQNLILNAVKFHAPEQLPQVNIQVKEASDSWYFSVQDNGIGIEKSYFDKIFLIFKRLNKKDVFEGTGIGLAICKKVVDLHGGKIWVESEVGQGANFQFTIAKN